MKKLLIACALVSLLIPSASFAKKNHQPSAPKLASVFTLKIPSHPAPKLTKTPIKHPAAPKPAPKAHYVHMPKLVTGWGNNI